MPIVQFSLFPDVVPDKKNRERLPQPQQLMMFSPVEICVFGLDPNPKFSLPPTAMLRLQSEDPRTEEEKERDAMLAAQEMTEPLFKEEESNAQ